MCCLWWTAPPDLALCHATGCSHASWWPHVMMMATCYQSRIFSAFFFSVHPQQFAGGLPCRGCLHVLHLQTRQAFNVSLMTKLILGGLHIIPNINICVVLPHDMYWIFLKHLYWNVWILHFVSAVRIQFCHVYKNHKWLVQCIWTGKPLCFIWDSVLSCLIRSSQALFWSLYLNYYHCI